MWLQLAPKLASQDSGGVHDFSSLGPAAQKAIERALALVSEVANLPGYVSQMEGAASERYGSMGPVMLHAYLGILAANRLLHISASEAAHDVTFVPYTAAIWEHVFRTADFSTKSLSRFALLRPSDESGSLLLECPRAHAHFIIRAPEWAKCVGELLRARRISEVLPLDDLDDDTTLLLAGLNAAGFLIDAADSARLSDLPKELPQWEFHDLYLHSRSRLGRQSDQIGGTYRMAPLQPPDPVAVFRRDHIASISLPLPSPDSLRQLTLGEVMDSRCSVRKHAAGGLSISQLASFLHSCFFVRGMWKSGEIEFTKRPYPSGGASYDLEVYLLVNRVAGLAAGTYHYDPFHHALGMLTPDNALLRAMLDDSYRASAETCYPDVLLVLASRFRRVTWKYSGMGYTTILKNLGVAYGTMYMVATALRLAPCALGLGDSDKFSRLTGIDYYEEGSVGEFMLGALN